MNTCPSTTPLSRRARVAARIETPHAVGPGRQRAGRAGARHRPVLRPRLQYRLAHGLGDRAREASLAHHHRHPRHADGDRADQAPARAPGAGAPRDRPDASPGRRSSASWRMVKVRGKGEHRVEALRLADAFRARVIDATHRELRVRDHRRDRQDRQLRQR